jgi:hypothetical protein
VTQSYTPDTPTSIPPATCGYDVAVRQLPGVDQLLYIEADSFRDVAWRVRQRLGSGDRLLWIKHAIDCQRCNPRRGTLSATVPA